MAQKSDIVLFTQSDEPFTLILNGIQQSPQPVMNIRITDLHSPSYKVTVRFQNTKLPEIHKTIYMQASTETTYEVLKNRKGVWVMRLLNQAEVEEMPAPQPEKEQVVYVYSPTPRVSTTTISQTTTVNTGVGLPFGASVTTTTSQTTTTVEGGHVQPAGGSESHGDDEGHHGGKVEGRGDDNRPPGEGVHEHDEYRGPTGCRRPMSDGDFQRALRSITSKNFESSKMTVAKQVAAANCLRCAQVKEIMKEFGFESTRLEFAKYAYKFTWDLRNYYLLNDAFQFESSIEELNRYIEGE